ncbi:uncharacterized protein LOC129740123 [Uranotaenia lowii]|uniref:uncharacterized protein LOC129740123 n=1 Tax=Uranotaenia lowii TaxID=190385 RepID=UPI0024797E0E|nr:uncharacterized protein LOC129740123 [Uranotaenia lowii]XP_055587706.1 uncharacterized protein LOC129740123 [Uranotaenia lowii]XP_055587707.1 uncharacterized protein LOC129740123 [Uranotaenia lowii]XP_055587708.1 uncharacterized protein LOC129740123 [Uranotaenia lowii]
MHLNGMALMMIFSTRRVQLFFAIILVYDISSIETSQTLGHIIDGRVPVASVNRRAAAFDYHAENTGGESNERLRSRRSTATIVSAIGAAIAGQIGSQQSLCNKEGCSCLDQPILTINCEVHDSELTLSGQYNIPREARGLNLRLGNRRARLIIDSKQFANSLLNHVLVEGNYATGNGQEHVEFLSEAFCLNNGTFPELEVKNVHTVVFRKRTFCQEFKLNVTSASDVIIMPEAFSVPESEILLSRIRDIRIDEDAFRGSITTRLEIINSGIRELAKLRASFREIKFIGSTIKEVSMHAFDVNKIDSLIFENCEIGVLKSQAVTEKLLCKYFTMTGCKIAAIEKNFIADSGLTHFRLESNVINETAADAIKFTGISSTISNNKMIKTGKNWFYQNAGWTNVVIANNSFGEFNYFTLEPTAGVPEVCRFHGNSITQAQIRSFSFFQHQACSMTETSFNKLCSCDERWLKELYFQDYDKLLRESYCRVEETLRHCYNASTFNVRAFMQQVCDETTRTIDCSRGQKEKKVEPHFVSPTEIESMDYNDYYQYIAFAVAVIVLLVILILCIVFCRACCRKNSNSSADVVSNASFTMTHKPSKAFTKDDKAIINQTLEKIKEKQSPEMFEEIFVHTKKLLDGNSTETEKVLTIGEIVRKLNECENSGDDFVAFTDILYRHLAPSPSTSPHETIYAEPSVAGPGTTVLQATGTGPDHIYAELTSAAQPLLINEYAAPMDLNDPHYSEPVQIMNKDNTRTLITPYAIGNNIGATAASVHYSQKALPQPQPGPSRNLPDILSTNGGGNSGPAIDSPSSSGVQSAVPQLRYMDRSPTSSREIPEYTLPAKKVPPQSKPVPLPRIEHQASFDSDSSSSTSNSSSGRSDHSGGSDVTVKIDDIVEYADA